MNSISVVHYTQGEDAPFYPLTEEHLSIRDALTDMFRRLKAGADMAVSGYNYGLMTYIGPEEAPTGWDKAIYASLDPKLQNFIIRATKWWEQDEGMEPSTAKHDRFIRRLLLQATDHDLDDAKWAIAEHMPEDEFLAAMAMAIETGENVGELFHPGVATS